MWGTSQRDEDDRVRSCVVQREERQAGEPQDVAALEVEAPSAVGLEVDGTGFDDDEGVQPLGLVVGPAFTGGDHDDVALEPRRWRAQQPFELVVTGFVHRDGRTASAAGTHRRSTER